MIRIRIQSVSWSIGIVFLFLLLLGASDSLCAQYGELLIFKPHLGSLKYSLKIKTHSELETNSSRRVTREHEDLFTLRQSIEEMDGGLLNISLTVDEINVIPHGASIGAQYKREQIKGNSQHLLINLLGEVQEATGLPHFGSRNFYFDSLDGVPLDMYRVMVMLYPQFPMELLRKGDTWNVRDKITVKAADASSAGEVATLSSDLDMTINRRIKYTLLDFLERRGYRTAHIAFQATYGFEVSMMSTFMGFYSDGSGQDEGEFYFAPQEGMVVETSIKSHPVENKSMDGPTVRAWLDPETPIFLNLEDRTTVPLRWRSDKTISFELAEPR